MLDHLCSTLDEVKFPCGGATWTLDPQNFMKVRKNPENVCPGLRILLHHNAMCWYLFFSFPDIQAAGKYKNLHLKMKMGKDIWLSNSWSKLYNFLTAVVSTSQPGSQHFIEIWPEFAPPSKMVTLTLKSFVVGGLIKVGI